MFLLFAATLVIMISAMPAVAVRRERKKQQRLAAAAANGYSSSGSAAGSRRGSLSSLPSPSTRSSSLLSSPLSAPGGYYNYFISNGQRPGQQLQQQRRPSSASASSAPAAPSRRPSASVSTISSAASNYVSALHKVRERQLETQRERARFLVYTGSVLLASGAALVVIGLVARTGAAQTVGLLFMCMGSAFCLARVFCLVPREELPLVKRARTVSGQSIYVPSASAHQSAATTPGTDDSSTTSSYYFSAVPLHRIQQQPVSPETPTATAPPPLQPPPPVVVPGVHGAVGSHRSNPSSLLTPMSLNSIPEMQVLITDDSQSWRLGTVTRKRCTGQNRCLALAGSKCSRRTLEKPPKRPICLETATLQSENCK
ncbi:uncharacterized protein CDAR_181221 [Caerostris darwini]|uniref:Uncharacterized protein n=1 Tax=Caerostris darwini TaxID=1538125 RepID=A0AAV4U420_9ARAC|nr:uncharacterized protein CDAR_181221 [Caerostris darwini]